MVVDWNEIKNNFIQSKVKKEVVLFKKVTSNQPNWDSFIQHIHYQYNNGSSKKVQMPNEETSIGGIILRNYFYLGVDHPLKTDYFPEAEEAAKFLEFINDKPFDGSRSFVNFAGNEKPIGVHYDDIDTFYWQCIGTSEWRIYQDHKKDEYSSYFLEPGDIIYAPEKCFHSVITKKPRAAIAFGYVLST